jgi:hypothetical protein
LIKNISIQVLGTEKLAKCNDRTVEWMDKESNWLGDMDAIKLARYKFVLTQKDELNKNTFKIMGFYQVYSLALLGGASAVFWGWGEKGLSPELARVSIVGFLLMFSFLTLFTVASLIAGVRSWLDYRKEEYAFLTQAGLLASPPKLANAWRWQETYLAISVASAYLFVIIFSLAWLLPRFIPV